MSDEENQVVEQPDQAVQAADQAAESEAKHDDRHVQPIESTSRRKDAEYNWSETRRKMAELERITREQQEVINQLTAQKPKEDDLSEDDLLTVKQLNRVNARRDEATLKELQRQKEEILRLRYPDIDQILSRENLDVFQEQEPELAESLAALQGDPVKLKVAAYKMIKKTIGKDTTPSTEKIKAESNSRKPVSVQSVGKGSAISNISSYDTELTPELKKQLYKEMQEARKGF